ncbi:xyloglucan:xyloglucosyl transferase [Ranunculus cassubicifolius]
MALLQTMLLSAWLLVSFMPVMTSARGVPYKPPNLKHLTDLFPSLKYDQGFKDLYGGSHIKVMENGSSVDITLDKASGSGFASQNDYYYGFFSAAIKLPPGLTSGVVVAFYMSNADLYPHNHDEIDIELLGHDSRKEWIVQTNIYVNGSTNIGREEKFRLWFDPTENFHSYSLIWNNHHTVFLIDNVPVREVIHINAMPYPLKPMSLYSTIWDASDWATNGGKSPVNYKYAPYVASFTQLQMSGCTWDKTKQAPLCIKNNQGLSSLDPVDGDDFSKLSPEQKMGMDGVRKRLMIYSYCKDPRRYKVLPPECKR